MLWFLTVFLFDCHVVWASGGGESKYHYTGAWKGEPRTERSIYQPLLEHIFEGYSPLAMPLCETGQPTNVQIDMRLYQLFDLDEPSQALTIDVWIDLTWMDCMLSWNPANFSGIDQVTVKADEIWSPDILTYQSLHGNYEEGLFVFRNSVAKIKHTGLIQLGCQLLLRTFCRVKLRDFPFDTQVCNITFTSWNKDATVFNLTRRDSHGDQRGHSFSTASNGEWEVLGLPAYNSMSSLYVGVDESTASNYTEVTFQLKLKRKPTYVQMYLIFPCLLLVWAATITFILPVESGEKISLSVTFLLSLIVFLLLLANNIPRTSDDIPIIGVFYCFSIVLVCVSVLMTTVVLNVGLKPQEVCVPKWVRRLLQSRITLLLCFRYEEKRRSHKWVSFKMKPKENIKEIDDDSAPPCSKNDWRYLALFLDRLFFYIYLICCIANTIYVCSAYPAVKEVSTS